MRNTKNKLINILSREKWNEDEKQWMFQFLESADASLLKEVMQDEFISGILEPNTLNSDVSNNLLAHIHEKIGAEKKPEKKKIPLWNWRMAAAASLFLILIAGVFYFLINIKQEQEIAKTEKPSWLPKDALPGGNKAILTLANGATIILDSIQNGMLAEQGSSKIVKLDDGQVAYQPTSKNGHEAAIQFNSISTPRGGQYRLILVDGTKVWLNAASSIRFPTSFTGSERTVDITGEAYFEVAHNSKMPFHLKANEVDIQVLGTHFNVNAYADEASTKVTLLGGSVKVLSGNSNKTIVPGEQAVIESGLEEITVKNGIDTDGVIAWKNGYFSFNNTDLKSLMRQISRWYNVDVIYEGEPSAERFVGEVSRNSNVSEILKILELSNVHSRFERDKIIIEH